MSANSSTLRSNRVEQLFNSRRIAVIGASEQGMYPAGILQNLMSHGFRGDIYPVNPRRETVFGIQAYPDIFQTPERPDLALFVIRRETVIPILRQCLQAGVPNGCMITAGFSEEDDTGAILQREIEEMITHSGFTLVGPNCAGFADIPKGLICTRLHGPALPGHFSFVSQSGALMMALYGAFTDRNLGVRRILSVGNQVDVMLSEVIENFALDADTRVIGAFIEGLKDGTCFVNAAKTALQMGKPIVAIKAGRTAAGQKAATSHTAALAGSYRVFQAVCKQFNIVLVDDLNELIDSVQMMSSVGELPAERKLRTFIITQSGGLGVLTADFCEMAGFELPESSQNLRDRLRNMHHTQALNLSANPIDVRGKNITGAITYQTLQPFMEDMENDLVVVAMAKPQYRSEDIEASQAILSLSKETGKPVVVIWSGPKTPPDRRSITAENTLTSAGIPVFDQPGSAIKALARAAGYWRTRQKWLDRHPDGG
jgi:acyl-CoA synthetase (NDP forming)